ncbi:TIGR03943 family putative permease subunit [Propionispora vibrioides]|uniref:Putative membrane protein n=1 Tax=Propionispora vibrioides TaxID=112903 RepID=A0A1H8V4X0_9FIRM|nr:TIGR03943 family protein [Propionispora vibrioides]SEP10263.1 putative membrane protein [Propionispora vibrioides]
MKPRKRPATAFHWEALVRFLLLTGLISLFVWLDMTDQFSYYINPRFSPLVRYAYWLLLPLLVIQFFDLLLPSPSHTHHHYGKYLPFCIILLLAVLLPDQMLNASLVASKGLNSQTTVLATAVASQPRPLKEALQQAETIVVDSNNYTEVMSEINDFPQDYIGKKLTMTGFVFRSPGLGDRQLSLVRYVMVCCAADALPYGVMCETADAKKYPDGTWLSGTGVIAMGRYKDQDTPVIQLTSVEKVAAPEKPYVFPYTSE